MHYIRLVVLGDSQVGKSGLSMSEEDARKVWLSV